MLFQAIIGASLEALKYFSVGSLHMVIALWVSNRGIAYFYARSSQYPWNALLVNWGPLSVMILFGTPNLQMMDLINLTADCLLILTTGVASSHLVNLLMVT
jgi:hypothetical protein